jgi:hypothetical protein
MQNFLSIYDTVSDEARTLWDALEALASDVESTSQDVLAEVLRLAAAWGAEPSTAQGAMLAAVYTTHLHRLGGAMPKPQASAPRELERFVSLLLHNTFKATPDGRLPVAAIMPAVRAVLAEDARLAKLAEDSGFTVAPNSRGYRLLKQMLAEGATRVTNASGRQTLHGWTLRTITQSTLSHLFSTEA